jgi:hypothetical protein
MTLFHPAATFGPGWCLACGEPARGKKPGYRRALFKYPKREWERQVILDVQEEEEEPGGARRPGESERGGEKPRGRGRR